MKTQVLWSIIFTVMLVGLCALPATARMQPCIPDAPPTIPKVELMPPSNADKAIEITFVDPGIELAVRSQLGRATGPIYDTDVWGFNYLDASNRGVQVLVDLVYMPNLDTLRLAHNPISSLELMPTLDNLYFLDLTHTELASLAGMPELPRLGELQLDYCRLKSLQGMTWAQSLGYLTVTHNDLQNFEGMQPFANLGYLNAAFNQLSTVAGLYDNSPLWQMDVSHNRLINADEIGQLTAINWLDLSHNDLHSIQGLDVQANFNLQHLDVSHNRLASLSGLEQKYRLYELDASHNRIGSFEGLPELGRIYFLNLSHNEITSMSGFPSMPDLSNLDLSCNKVASLSDMPVMPQLRSLEARFNRLDSPKMPIQPSLRYLGLSSNQLALLQGLEPHPALGFLDVSFNALTSLDGVAVVQSLWGVIAHNNQLADLSGVAGMAWLGFLDVSGNGLTSLQTLPQGPPLKSIKTSHNRLVSLDGLASAAGLYLEYADVSYNELTSLASLDVASTMYLVELKASHNQIASLQGIAAAQKLYRLDVTNNAISDLSPVTGWSFTALHVANNPTGSVLPLLQQLPNYFIKELSLDSNQANGFADLAPWFSDLTVLHAYGPAFADLQPLMTAYPSGAYSLRELWVEDAQVSDISSLLNLWNLRNLRLRNCNITSIDGIGTGSLDTLDLSGNQISDIQALGGAFWYGTARFINVSSNPVQSLDPLLAVDNWQAPYPWDPGAPYSFNEVYALEYNGFSPEEAQQAAVGQPWLNITNTPVVADPAIAELELRGLSVTTDGTYQGCEACCTPVDITMPDVRGLTPEETAIAIRNAGLTIADTVSVCSDAVSQGLVASQSPVAGATVPEGSTVVLAVSSGPCPVVVFVPNVTGQDSVAATATLQTAGLVVGSLATEYNSLIPAGFVIRQDLLPGSSVPQGTAVNLVISLGPQPAEGEGEGEPQPSLDEAARRMYDNFAIIDTDGDGKLSLADAQAAESGLTAEQFAQLDLNSDGILTEEELASRLGFEPGGCFSSCAGHDSGNLLQGLLSIALILLGLLGVDLLGGGLSK